MDVCFTLMDVRGDGGVVDRGLERIGSGRGWSPRDGFFKSTLS